MTCSVAGCENPVRSIGLCVTHYGRQWRTGNPEGLRRPAKIEPGTACRVEGCEEPVRARGWCRVHYYRWKRQGDPLKVARLPKRPPGYQRPRYPITTRPDHPLASSRGTVPVHRMVLYDKIGPGWHACHWCSARVSWNVTGIAAEFTLTADHLDGNTLNNAPENLVPSCWQCNVNR